MIVVHPLSVSDQSVISIGSREIAIFMEKFGADQERFESKARTCSIGGVSRTHRGQGKHLPPALACGSQGPGKGMGSGTQVSNAEVAWQGGGMKQDPARSLFESTDFTHATPSHDSPAGVVIFS
jgi:hypothetical protein